MNHTSKTHNEIIKQFFSQNNRFIMHKVQKNEETRHYIFFSAVTSQNFQNRFNQCLKLWDRHSNICLILKCQKYG